MTGKQLPNAGCGKYCRLVQYSDLTECAVCDVAFDTNDIPPKCGVIELVPYTPKPGIFDSWLSFAKVAVIAVIATFLMVFFITAMGIWLTNG